MTPMVVQCSSCLTEFELDPNKVPTAGVRARCSVCSAVITVPAPPSTAPDSAQEQVAEPAVAATPVAPVAAPASSGAPEPAAAAAPPAAESWRPATAAPSVTPPSTPPDHVAGEASEDASVAPVAESPWTMPKPSIAPAISPVEADGGQRRPINPFLTRDPALRAKRLARALVSDIVAYHPARHAEGLRDGTLKTLFRDEIKKSYEEYVDQVGRDFAGSTTHFQDALNDVLASGKKLF